MSHGAPPSTRPDAGRATKFLLRGNGLATPLIPADELPDEFVIAGVPRIVHVDDTAGMTVLGPETKRPEAFEVNYSPLPPASDAQGEQQPSSEELERENRNRRQILLLGEEKLFPLDTGRPVVRLPPPGAYSARTVPILPRPSPPTPPENRPPLPALLPTGLCRRWFDTGACDKEGCLGVHDMPDTRHELDLTGQEDWPLWFKRDNRRRWRKIRDRLSLEDSLRGPDNDRGTTTAPTTTGARPTALLPVERRSPEGIARWHSFAQDEPLRVMRGSPVTREPSPMPVSMPTRQTTTTTTTTPQPLHHRTDVKRYEFPPSISLQGPTPRPRPPMTTTEVNLIDLGDGPSGSAQQPAMTVGSQASSFANVVARSPSTPAPPQPPPPSTFSLGRQPSRPSLLTSAAATPPRAGSRSNDPLPTRIQDWDRYTFRLPTLRSGGDEGGESSSEVKDNKAPDRSRGMHQASEDESLI